MTEDELKSIETDVETWAQGLDSAMVRRLVAEVRRLREALINVERIYTPLEEDV